MCYLVGLAFDPGEHVTFFPAQVLADPVSGQLPGPPLVPDGAFGDGEYVGYVAGG